MIIKAQLLCLFLLGALNWNISKQEFYEVFGAESLTRIEQMIQKLENETSNTSLKQAYTGALFMKRAGVVKSLGEKMSSFKKGKLMLEAEITKYPQNVEYCFLRLSIQENAPRILAYYKDVDKDKQVIIKAYDRLDKDLKKIISDYAKTSNVLKSSDL
ncbi:MAG: hypothetical protein MK212_17340 [Saprospiraceae bacterium]|nr:hypothetical protein [Saprospiraceae bacterium]